jgi:hypothetical protein
VPRQLPLNQVSSKDHFLKRKFFEGLILEENFEGTKNKILNIYQNI